MYYSIKMQNTAIVCFVQIPSFPSNDEHERHMLIISNQEFTRGLSTRQGTERDVENLQNTFQKRRYNVHVERNLEAQVSDIYYWQKGLCAVSRFQQYKNWQVDALEIKLLTSSNKWYKKNGNRIMIKGLNHNLT